jgi:restriction system protein
MKIYNAQESWVVTNNGFTPAAVETANKNDVRLIGQTELLNYINEMNPSQNPNPLQIKKEIQQHTGKRCKECGSELLIRKGTKGIFYGCSNFPRCRYTEEAI